MIVHSASQVAELMRLVQAHAALVGSYCSPIKAGGVFHCRHVGRDGWLDAHATIIVGAPDPEKVLKYWELAQEKADRLANHREKGHRSSYQSRDPARMKWGGAICTPDDWILSFSGFPELMDEGFMLALAHTAQLMSWQEAVAVTRAHKDSACLHVALNRIASGE